MRRTFSFISLVLITLSIVAQPPTGYYSAINNKRQKELKTTLHRIIREATMLRYGGGKGATWEGFYHTDRHKGNQVFDRYSDIPREFNGFKAVAGMHIEHSLPKSWWGGIKNNAYCDLHHLYPSDGPTNSSKGNNPLGEVASPAVRDNGVSKTGKNTFGKEYHGNAFEPSDEYKGDFARSYFYMSTAYEDYAPLWNSEMMSNTTYPVWRPWAVRLLLKWHRQDPVSDLERQRTEEVYKIQGNRNPFIDHPELAEYIWGKDTANVYQEIQPIQRTTAGSDSTQRKRKN